MSGTEVVIKWHPLLLVKPKTMSRQDIRRAEKLGGICVVECAEPETARFVEAPLHVGTDALAGAALALVRFLQGQPQGSNFGRNEIAKWYVDFILKSAGPAGTPAVPTVPPVKK
jgi:hypothetical protein